MFERSGQVKVSSPVWKDHLCEAGDPTGDRLLGWSRRDLAETSPHLPPSISTSPSIVSLLLSALSSSFRSPETEGRAAAVPQRKGKDLRKGLKKKRKKKKTKRESRVGDQP